MRIVVPSINRAGSVTTTSWLPDAWVAVPHSQVRAYEAYHPQVIAIPDALDGHIATKRNAILDGVDDDIFLIDDDMRGFRCLSDGRTLDAEESLWLISQGFCLMHESGAGLWGVNVSSDPMKWASYQPFSLTKPVYGAVGIKRDSVRYDTRLAALEDVDFYLQKLRLYRRVLRYQGYSVVTHTQAATAGRKARERACQEVVMQKWGPQVVSFRRHPGAYDIPVYGHPIKGV